MSLPLALSNRAANWLVNANSFHFLSVHHVCATALQWFSHPGEPDHGQQDQQALKSLIQRTQGTFRPP